MAKIALVGTITAHEGKGDELVAAFSSLFDAAEQEPGTLAYVLHRTQDDPDVIFFYELFASEDALATHQASDAMKAAAPQFTPLIKQGERMLGDVVQATPFKSTRG